MKPFFAFVVALLFAGVAFGFYISGLQTCSAMSAGSSGITELECHKLYLAFGVLFAVAILLLLAAAFYAFVPAPEGSTELPGKQIFENFAKILPPIITLVLGYYFGSTAPSTTTSQDRSVGIDQKQRVPATTQERSGSASEPTRR